MNENCWKKNRFVNRWIRFSSMNVVSVLSRLIMVVSNVILGRCLLVEKLCLCGVFIGVVRVSN